MKLAKFVGVGLLGAAAVLGSVGAATSSHATAAPAAAADGAFKVDPVHSSVVFRIKHNDVSYFYGRFNKIEGSFSIDPADASKNSAEATLTTDSIDTNNAGRDRDLKSQTFFSAAEFPSISFKTKSWKSAGTVEGAATFDVVGDLTLHGQTKEVAIQIRHTGTGQGRAGELAGLEARFNIKRSEFGMNAMVGKALGDEVTVMVGLEGGRK